MWVCVFVIVYVLPHMHFKFIKLFKQFHFFDNCKCSHKKGTNKLSKLGIKYDYVLCCACGTYTIIIPFMNGVVKIHESHKHLWSLKLPLLT